jgi:hypothetical protein
MLFQFMMTAVEGMYGGLNGLAELLRVERVGPMHQAGSDSLLTSCTFFTLVQKHLGGVADESRCELFYLFFSSFFCFFLTFSIRLHRFRGELFGLGNNHTKYRVKGAFLSGGGVVQSGGGSGMAGMVISTNLPANVPPGGMVRYSLPSQQQYGYASEDGSVRY